MENGHKNNDSEEYKLCECGCGQPVKRAHQTYSSRGVKKGDFNRYVVGHQSRPHPRPWEEEDKGYATNCWMWKWSQNRHGFPYHSGTGLNAKRWVYQQIMGELPKELFPVSNCGERLCVNPFHAKLMTRSELISFYSKQGNPAHKHLRRAPTGEWLPGKVS